MKQVLGLRTVISNLGHIKHISISSSDNYSHNK